MTGFAVICAVAGALAWLALVLWLVLRHRRLAPLLLLCHLAALVGLYGAELQIGNRRFGQSMMAEVGRLRAAGEEAWPAVSPAAWYFDLNRAGVDAGRTLLPLAAIAGVNSVLCNEGAGWVTYRADRFGFRNPPRPDGAETYDAALVGDSFVQGNCVPEEHTLAGHLRRDGVATLNLGMAGTGPLFQLAILREYAARPRLARIVWVFFEGNDIYDLGREQGSVPLRAYLGDGPRQRLEERQSEIDALLRATLAGRDGRPSWSDVAALHELRTAWGLGDAGGGAVVLPEVAPVLPLLGEVLVQARRFAVARGAQFTFVYLPTPWRYHEGTDAAAYYRGLERAVTAEACRQGLDLVSMTRALAATGDPTASYARMGDAFAHLNGQGYRLLASALRERWSGRAASDCLG